MDTHEIKKKRRMIVDISKKSVKKIRELIVFTAFLVVALWKFNVVLDVLKAIWGSISICTWRSDRICDQRANELFGKENFWKGKKRK